MRNTSFTNESISPLLNEKQAAEYLGVTPRYLQYKRINGGGPPFIRLSHRCVRYQRQALVEYCTMKSQEPAND
jgi:hypothetical protein